MTYDRQWCTDMYELYRSTAYLTEPGWCVYYNINETRTTRYKTIRELNIELADSSVSYDIQCCKDIDDLYRSIFYTCCGQWWKIIQFIQALYYRSKYKKKIRYKFCIQFLTNIYTKVYESSQEPFELQLYYVDENNLIAYY